MDAEIIPRSLEEVRGDASSSELTAMALRVLERQWSEAEKRQALSALLMLPACRASIASIDAWAPGELLTSERIERACAGDKALCIHALSAGARSAECVRRMRAHGFTSIAQCVRPEHPGDAQLIEGLVEIGYFAGRLVAAALDGGPPISPWLARDLVRIWESSLATHEHWLAQIAAV